MLCFERKLQPMRKVDGNNAINFYSPSELVVETQKKQFYRCRVWVVRECVCVCVCV